MPEMLKTIRESYSKVGPTSVMSADTALKRKIQSKTINGTKRALLFGLKTETKLNNDGNSANNTHFKSVFHRVPKSA